MLFYILQPHPDQPGDDGEDIDVWRKFKKTVWASKSMKNSSVLLDFV